MQFNLHWNEVSKSPLFGIEIKLIVLPNFRSIISTQFMQIPSFVCEIELHMTFTIKFHVSATIIGKWEIKVVDKIDPFYETLKEIQIGAELVLFDGK